jgi:hypothetical protein
MRQSTRVSGASGAQPRGHAGPMHARGTRYCSAGPHLLLTGPPTGPPGQCAPCTGCTAARVPPGSPKTCAPHACSTCEEVALPCCSLGYMPWSNTIAARELERSCIPQQRRNDTCIHPDTLSRRVAGRQAGKQAPAALLAFSNSSSGLPRLYVSLRAANQAGQPRSAQRQPKRLTASRRTQASAGHALEPPWEDGKRV